MSIIYNSFLANLNKSWPFQPAITMFVCTRLRLQPRIIPRICCLFTCLRVCICKLARTHAQDKTSNSRYNWAEIGTPDKAAGLPADRNKSDCEMQIVSTAVLFLVLLNKANSLPLHLLLGPCIVPCLGKSPPHRWHRIFSPINHVLSPVSNKFSQRSGLCSSVGFKASLPWKTVQEHSLVAAGENSALAGHHPARCLRASLNPSEGSKEKINMLSIILHSGTRSFSQLMVNIIYQ